MDTLDSVNNGTVVYVDAFPLLGKKEVHVKTTRGVLLRTIFCMKGAICKESLHKMYKSIFCELIDMDMRNLLVRVEARDDAAALIKWSKTRSDIIKIYAIRHVLKNMPIPMRDSLTPPQTPPPLDARET